MNGVVPTDVNWHDKGCKGKRKSKSNGTDSKKGKGGTQKQSKEMGTCPDRNSAGFVFEKFDRICRRGGKHGHMGRDCWWKSGERVQTVQELGRANPTQKELSATPSIGAFDHSESHRSNLCHFRRRTSRTMDLSAGRII